VTDEDMRTWYNFSNKHLVKTCEMHNVIRTAMYLVRRASTSSTPDSGAAGSMRSLIVAENGCVSD